MAIFKDIPYVVAKNNIQEYFLSNVISKYGKHNDLISGLAAIVPDELVVDVFQTDLLNIFSSNELDLSHLAVFYSTSQFITN